MLLARPSGKARCGLIKVRNFSGIDTRTALFINSFTVPLRFRVVQSAVGIKILADPLPPPIPQNFKFDQEQWSIKRGSIRTYIWVEHVGSVVLHFSEVTTKTMSPLSPGRDGSPEATENRQRTRSHKFETFTKRIARLKIDPIHRVQRVSITDDDDGMSTSHFRASLDHWSDLNLSRSYTEFARRITPLCENLPQVLHHRDKLFETLIEAVEKRDYLSLEPLLSLTAHFAHDIGTRFEEYFERAVTVIADVAANNDRPDVVEWCFTCLAWIFKFLSRLLTPDLRPLLQILIPYLQHRKAYVSRFTAESLAFLLRRATVVYARNKAPLLNAVNFLLEIRTGGQTGEQQSLGIISLLAETGKGPDRTLHESAVTLLSCVYDSLARHDALSEQQMDIIEGVLTENLKNSDVHSTKPVVEMIYDLITAQTNPKTASSSALMTCMLLIAITVRKGSHIEDWTSVYRCLLRLDPLVHNVDSPSNQTKEYMLCCAMSLSQAPIQVSMQNASSILDVIENLPPTTFLQFCDLVAQVVPERFKQLVQPRLQSYLDSNWTDCADACCVFLRRTQQVSFVTSTNTIAQLPTKWVEGTMQALTKASVSDVLTFDVIKDGMLRPLTKNLQFLDHSRQDAFTTLAVQLVQEELDVPISSASLHWKLFIYGRLLATLLDMQRGPELLGPCLWQSFPKLPDEVLNLNMFLESLCKYAGRIPPEEYLSRNDIRALLDRLYTNLVGGQKINKAVSLGLILALTQDPQHDFTGAISTLKEILELPYTPATTRLIAMLLRRLPQHQRDATELLRKVIPYFVIGCLSQYHGELRQTCCSVLAEIAQDEINEKIILDVALSYLQNVQGPDSPPTRPVTSATASRRAFGNAKISRLRANLDEIRDEYIDARASMERVFLEDHAVTTSDTPASGRIIALEVLKAIPEIAERKSRLIVPAFLTALRPSARDDAVLSSSDSNHSRTLSPPVSETRWSFPERKMFLELVGKFQNVRVLYQADQVYSTLTELLKNGNPALQRLALDGILKWKDSTLIAWQSDLYQLLEDKTYTSASQKLLGTDDESEVLSGQQRSALMKTVLPLLYGQMVGGAGTFQDRETKRRATLRLILQLPDYEVAAFLDVCFNIESVSSETGQGKNEGPYNASYLPPLDHQHGLLRMLLSVLQIAQDGFQAFVPKVAPIVLSLTEAASQSLDRSPSEANAENNNTSMSLARSIRKVGLQCLELLFKIGEDMDWSLYIPSLFQRVVSPRLATFAAGHAEGVSWLLRCVATWCKSSKLRPALAMYDSRLLPSVWSCLGHHTVKDEVKKFIMVDMILPLLSSTEASSLDFSLGTLLSSLGSLIASNPQRDVVIVALQSVSAVAPFITSDVDRLTLLALFADVLEGPLRRGSPKERSALVQALLALIRTETLTIDESDRVRIWLAISALLNYFKDTPNRLRCCEILQHLAHGQDLLMRVANINLALNAVSVSGSLESNYDEQINAMKDCHSDTQIASTELTIAPVLFTLLYLSRSNDDEFSLRSNAVSTLKALLLTVLNSPQEQVKGFVKSHIVPVILSGCTEESEGVRADFVNVFGLVVQHADSSFKVEELKPLLVNNDEEASFFTNILHIQHHRRLRALGRLEKVVEQGSIPSNHISTFFLSLLETFVTDTNSESKSSEIRGQAIISIGKLLAWVKWPSFKARFKKYKMWLNSEAHSKDAVRLLGAAADAILEAVSVKSNTGEAGKVPCHLSTSLPDAVQLDQEVSSNFLTDLTSFIHQKDESQLSLRLPIALASIKLTTLLSSTPASSIQSKIVLDLCQVLRSRSQESRDSTRKLLAQALRLAGPGSINLVLKELKSVLTRGYQLHVLSFTLHSVLVENVSDWKNGDLDYCLPQLLEAAFEGIFGNVGQEKDNHDYTSTMREVKGNKNFDMIELLASICSPSALFELIRPLQSILDGNVTTKQARQVDEILRRIGIGLARNGFADSRDVLTFAYQIVQSYYAQKSRLTDTKDKRHKVDETRYLIELKSAKKTTDATTTTSAFKLARFAIELVRTTFNKHETLLTAQNAYGFIPVIGDVLLQGEDEVKISATKLLTTLVKISMPELDTSYDLYIRECVDTVRNAISTNSESAQASLKLLGALLREKPSACIRDSDLAYILQAVTPDLEDPDRQGVTFNFVKAIMARKFLLPEVYDIVDRIGTIMVTNQSKSARDAARGVYVHFLLTYPQTESRWSKQIKFLLKNLEYKYPEGRQSVMEAINTLLTKLQGQHRQDLITAFFMPVVLCMANDESEPCTHIAKGLLGKLFSKGEKSILSGLLATLRDWVDQSENTALIVIALQALDVAFESIDSSLDDELMYMRGRLRVILSDKEETFDKNHDVIRQALELCVQLTQSHPEIYLAAESRRLWLQYKIVSETIDDNIQYLIARLDNLRYTDIIKAGDGDQLSSINLKGQYGLDFTVSELESSIKQSLQTAKFSNDFQRTQHLVVQNLVFLSRLVAKDPSIEISIVVKAAPREDPDDSVSEMSEQDTDRANGHVKGRIQSIPAIQYLLHQAFAPIRREPSKYTTASLVPRQSMLTLLNAIVSYVSKQDLVEALPKLLPTLLHLTDVQTIAPRAVDPAFAPAWADLISSAQNLLEALQTHLGDSEYVRLVTQASRATREKRQEKKAKRAVKMVADPEVAEQRKRRKVEKQKDRAKELSGMFRDRRRAV